MAMAFPFRSLGIGNEAKGWISRAIEGVEGLGRIYAFTHTHIYVLLLAAGAMLHALLG